MPISRKSVSRSPQQLLHRAARELLTNVGKHAGAKTVRVGLKRKGDRLRLTIADDGRGFDPAVVGQSVADGHIGLGLAAGEVRRDGRRDGHRLTRRRRHRVTVTSPPEPATSSSAPAR